MKWWPILLASALVAGCGQQAVVPQAAAPVPQSAAPVPQSAAPAAPSATSQGVSTVSKPAPSAAPDLSVIQHSACNSPMAQVVYADQPTVSYSNGVNQVSGNVTNRADATCSIFLLVDAFINGKVVGGQAVRLLNMKPGETRHWTASIQGKEAQIIAKPVLVQPAQ